MKNKYAPFFTAYNDSKKRGNPLTKEEIVYSFTNQRTNSLSNLSHAELAELTRRMRNITPANTNKTYPGGETANKMRKAIIAIFRRMDRLPADAIAWAERQGVKGVKKAFNDYTTGELYVLIAIAEKVQQDWTKAVCKRVNLTFSDDQ